MRRSRSSARSQHADRGPGRHVPGRAGGFTLLELLVTLTLFMVLASIAAPAFNSYIANQGVKTGAQALLIGLSFARSAAIERNASVHLIAADTDDWAAGWIVTADSSVGYADCTGSNPPETCLRVHQGDQRIVIDGPSGAVTFNRQGRSESVVSFELCDAEETASVTKRVLRLDLSGRPNLAHDGDCAA